jgi:UDP-N-acetylglucosamine diphosphorylase/glucosamine-1-phosphate N-acetyltransferase
MIEDDKKGLSAIILAAGKGTRLKSDLVKVLHTIHGRPMLAYSIGVARAMGVEKIVVIVGYQGDLVKKAFHGGGVIFAEQREQLGTGHAVLQARDIFCDYEGTILILCGDVPLLKVTTIKNLLEYHGSEGAVVTVLTTVLDDPAGYGRVVKREEDDEVLRIVEAKDATPAEKKIREINTGIYCVDSRFLFEAVAEISNNNAQKEYYLTDMIEIACRKGFKVRSFIAENPLEVMGINTPEELERASHV